MVIERLLVFTVFFLTAILPVSAQEKSSLYIDTLNEVDKILGEHHFFKNATFENSDVIEELISNICLEFQNAVIDCLLHKTKKALKDFRLNQVVLSGGVAANKELRRRFSEELGERCSTIYPDFSHCTDNGTMIAFAGYEKLNYFKEDNKIFVNPRWSLEEIANG